VKSLQNEVAQCVRPVEVGAATNQVLAGSSDKALVEKAEQLSLGREGQAITCCWITRVRARGSKMVRLQVWKRTMYVNVRLIEITMGKKRWRKPNGVQVVTGEGSV
jgi:hypothetical protein